MKALKSSSKDHEAKCAKLVDEKRKMAKENELLREHGYVEFISVKNITNNFSAKYMTKRDNLRLVLNEQQKKTKELEDFKNNHEGTLAALQQKLKQTETEKQNFRAQLNVVERKLADTTDR